MGGRERGRRSCEVDKGEEEKVLMEKEGGGGAQLKHIQHPLLWEQEEEEKMKREDIKRR